MLLQYWNSLPESVKSGLRIGSVGAAHLRKLASAAAKCPGSTLHLEFLFAAWEEDPLDGDLAATILRLEEHRPYLDLELKQILTLVAEHWGKPDSIADYQAYIAAKQFEQGLVLVRQMLRGAPDNLFWRQQAVTLCELLGNVHHVHVFLKSGPSGLAPLFAFLRGNMYFLQGNWERAAQEYANAPENMMLACERRAEALERLGQADAATQLRSEILRQKPWHTTLILRTYENFRKNSAPSDENAGSHALLLYSFNKAADLNACLQSVAESRGWQRIFALNNGSTDQTHSVLQAWQQKMDTDKMRIISLPVNIGAAAARNWLVHEAAKESCDFVAFLDDDVVLPPDWMYRLSTARSICPEAGAWGCRVLDKATPYLAQSADMHLLPAPEFDPASGGLIPDESSQVLCEPFTVSDLHNQVADFGQFHYARPCDSVTGCCHLFSLKKLLDFGPFNLQLSPSQYDDLEHDIRMLSQGSHACYQGTLAILHAKQSGRKAHLDRPAFGNWLANKFKLLRMYSKEEIQKIRQSGDRRLEEDLTGKQSALDAALGLDMQFSTYR